MTARKRRRIVTAVIVTAVFVAFAGAAYSYVRPGPHGFFAQPENLPAARAAGQELADSAGKTFLVIVAHPDDAEWWAGGTLAGLSKRNRVILVDSTSGDKAYLGMYPGMASLREGLERQAAEVLGYADVVFLRHGDQHLCDAASYPAEVESLFAKYRPDAVITFDTDDESQGYRHVDHECAGRTTLAVARKLGGPTLYLIHSSAPNVAVDASPQAAAKAEALTILTSYNRINPLWWAARALGLFRPPSASAKDGTSGYQPIGFGTTELFRKTQP
jgi:LmbE family N-acetylglucosaminyl deacetylase